MLHLVSKKKRPEDGFTLAELLVVVAIIAVLVAIAIPVFSAQQEKAREAVDLANIRSAYAQIKVDAISGEAGSPITLNLKQEKEGWVTTSAQATLVELTNSHVVGAPQDGTNTATVEWLSDVMEVKITFNGGGSGEGGSEGGGGSSVPQLQPTAGILDTKDIANGTVLQDSSGKTCVVYLGATWAMTNEWRKNPDVDAFMTTYPGNTALINPLNVKNCDTEEYEKGDVVYLPSTGEYYYIRNTGSGPKDDKGMWVALIP